MDKATVGRILHWTARGGEAPGLKEGDIRPAIVVRVWPNEYPNGIDGKATEPQDGYNVQVFLDGCAFSEPGPHTAGKFQGGNDGAAFLWVTSAAICEKPTPGNLHWPQRG